mmetsp:Transcript_6840/g.11330  ORF Transcript_6840/g.11330 Transcript_6840/m.11330 type:complete len:138 (+) Transcript_6840:361-774(+)|eukprot:CAMPEP_0119004178 /NCGR_PEP_ID=MMETSP1176-20130426/1001_1 /TAXON_ID=265551 /ORGANISM="Synedropsis recta cf, Strain CCMP1620" /LENGTH=137 /DNA_ID=CAMNT_0006955859 /DNA_START=479 /DNA_END=892 /DNA_ORIENTATION=-
MRGEWWFYDETDSLHDYKAKARLHHEEAAELQMEEGQYFEFLAPILAYDYFGYYAQEASIENVFPEAVTVSLLDTDSAAQNLKNTFGGLAMPADRFVEIYRTSGMLGSDGDRKKPTKEGGTARDPKAISQVSHTMNK